MSSRETSLSYNQQSTRQQSQSTYNTRRDVLFFAGVLRGVFTVGLGRLLNREDREAGGTALDVSTHRPHDH